MDVISELMRQIKQITRTDIKHASRKLLGQTEQEINACVLKFGMNLSRPVMCYKRNLSSTSTTISTGNTAFPKSTRSRNSNSSVHIQIIPKSQHEFVPRDTDQSEVLELVEFGGVAISGETVIRRGASYSRLLKIVGLFCKRDL